MAIKPLSISDLEDSGDRGSIWVMNSAQKSEYELEGEILINIPTAQGRPEMLKVPQSWLPYEATGRFPKKRILESVEFRNALMKGLITAITEADAHAIMNEDGAREERKRLRDLDQHIKAAGAPRKISDANVSITNPQELTGGNTTPVDIVGGREESVASQIKAGAQPDEKTGLKPNFMAFYERVKTQDDTSALNALKNKGRFSRRELRFLRDNLPNHPKTVQTIKSRLVELKKASQAAE
jgi:hypothetical protein